MPSNRLCIAPPPRNTKCHGPHGYERRLREVEVAILALIVGLEIADMELRHKALEVGTEVMRQLREQLAAVAPRKAAA